MGEMESKEAEEEGERPLEEDLDAKLEQEEKAPKAQAKEGGEDEAEESQETAKPTVGGSPSGKVQYSLARLLGLSPHEKPVLEEKM